MAKYKIEVEDTRFDDESLSKSEIEGILLETIKDGNLQLNDEFVNELSVTVEN